jgi:uncharacterized integral membrane protein
MTTGETSSKRLSLSLVALLLVILVIAVAWNLTNTGVRILPKYFAVPADSPVALLIGALMVILVVALGYVAARARH